MKDYYQQSIKALQLAGMSKSTQLCYTRSVRQLVDFYKTPPKKITEEQVQNYFLHRRNKDKWSAATLRIAQSGIKFFFINVLKRNWHTFSYLNAKRERRLPCILSREAVYRVSSKVKTFHNCAFLSTVCACGLRLSEALAIQVSDIDKSRMMIHVHRGKGAKDRFVPLPAETLGLLRRYWATHKNPVLVFPALGRGQNRGLCQKPPWLSIASRALFARHALPPGSKSAVSRYTPCATATPPICSKRAPIPE